VAQPDRLKITRTQRGKSGWKLELSGVIDETFDAPGLLKDISGTVVIDLDKVERITSFGVREWVRAIRSQALEYLCFVNVRPSIVSQFNMISGFGGSGEIVTLFAPFACTSCDEITEVVFDLRREHASIVSDELPQVKCSKCGSTETEFDDFAQTYFACVINNPPPSPNATARAIIDGVAEEPTASVPFRIEKEVEGNVTALWLYGSLDKARRLKRIADGLQGEVVCVFKDLTSIEPDGLLGLKSFTSMGGTELFFARVPAKIAPQLIGATGKARVLSVVLPLRCRACQTVEPREAGAKSLSQLLTGQPSEERCPRCSSPLFAQLERSQVEALLSLPIAVGSNAVRNYLSDHMHGPTLGRAPAPRGGSKMLRGPLTGRFGDYEILASLGVGGMGEVMLARKIGLQGFEKKVVLKRILPQYAADAPRLEMFLSEAKIAAKINHPNVVQIFDLGQIEGEYFIAMEYVEGWDCGKIARRCNEMKTRWPVDLACFVATEICAALRAAQEHRDESGTPQPIVHRDVSPENVFISRDGAVKLGDFGVAKVVDRQSLTQPGSLKGKLGYMAPERLMGSPRPVDSRVDIYAAGVILHECLAGKRLFVRDHEGQTLFAIVEHQIPKLHELRNDVPPELDQILAKALAKDPDARYGTAAELRMDLEQLLMRFGRPVSSPRLAAWLVELFQGAMESHDGRAPTSSVTSSGDHLLTSPMLHPPSMTQAAIATVIPDARDDE
jgi:eukaryotic-like serine/threonine-protein kinase